MKSQVTVTLDASRLAVNQTHNTALVIKTNGSELRVPISCVPVDVAAPSTSSSQDPATPPPPKKSTAKTRAVGWVSAAVIFGVLFITYRLTVNEKPVQRNLDRSVGGVQTSSPTVSRADVPAGMVLIPGGEFQMGNSDSEADEFEKPVHTVYLDAFYMDKYEVTNAQFKAFVDANPQWRKDRIPRAYHNGYYLYYWNGNIYPQGMGNYPVVEVSWYAAMAYAQWKGKRLPTEAEWEKSARGGLVGKNYPWGNVAPNGTQCNFADKNLSEHWNENWGENYSDENADDGYSYRAPIGSYPPNGYGLYDMAGNVWEWCLDGYDAGFYARSASSPRRNPVSRGESLDQIVNMFTHVKSNRMLRGGSWLISASYLRVAFRFWGTPTHASDDLGFRCARAVTP